MSFLSSHLVFLFFLLLSSWWCLRKHNIYIKQKTVHSKWSPLKKWLKRCFCTLNGRGCVKKVKKKLCQMDTIVCWNNLGTLVNSAEVKLDAHKLTQIKYTVSFSHFPWFYCTFCCPILLPDKKAMYPAPFKRKMSDVFKFLVFIHLLQPVNLSQIILMSILWTF